MNQFVTKTLSVIGAVAFLALPASSLAKTERRSEGFKHSVSAKVRLAKLDTSCIKDAAKAFVAAIHKANADYRAARDSARTTLKSDLKAADTRAEKRAAVETYRASMKVARDKMKADKKTALQAFRDARSDCRTTEGED